MYYIQNSFEINTSLKTKVRNFVRNKALDIFSLKNNLNNLNKPRIQFLYFHHVFKNEEKKLELLLNHLSKYHTFISYSQAVEKLITGTIDKSYICFSSDDGFKNNVTSAAIFNKYNISCCYFICPKFIGMKDTKEVSAQKFHLPPIEFLNWDDLEFLKNNGHEIGSHTMNHFRLSALNNNQIIEELETSKNKIEEKIGTKNIHFAYPYGLQKDINQFAINTVHQLNYASCASAIRGVHFNKLNLKQDLIKRDQVIFDWKQSHINYFLLKNIN